MKTVYRVIDPQDGSWLRRQTGRVIESSDGDAVVGVMLSVERACGRRLSLVAGVSGRFGPTWFEVDFPRIEAAETMQTVAFGEIPLSRAIAMFPDVAREKAYETVPEYVLAFPAAADGWFRDGAVVEVSPGKAARAVAAVPMPVDWPHDGPVPSGATHAFVILALSHTPLPWHQAAEHQMQQSLAS